MNKFLFYNKFIICLYMFRALFCTSESQIVQGEHLLQEKYVEYKHIFLPLIKLVSKIYFLNYIFKKLVCIPRKVVFL